MEKFYFCYTENDIKIIFGNFKTRFGMGLTFAKTNSLNSGIIGMRQTFHQNNTTKKTFIDNNFLKGFDTHIKIKDFEIFYILSYRKNPIYDISIIVFENKKSKKTINKL